MQGGNCRLESGLQLFILISSPPSQNGHHFPNDIFKCIFMNEKICIFLQSSLKFVPKGPIDNNPALVHRFSQKWQIKVCKLNFRVCKMPLLMKIPMKMKEYGWFQGVKLAQLPMQNTGARLANTMIGVHNGLAPSHHLKWCGRFTDTYMLH